MLARKIGKILKKAQKAHKLIDDLVCDLYDIDLHHSPEAKEPAKDKAKKVKMLDVPVVKVAKKRGRKKKDAK